MPLKTTPFSEFDRFIVLDWYDGIVHAVAHSASKQTDFACGMVAVSDDLDIRCFLCATLPHGAFAGCVTRLPRAGPLTSPVWVPYVESPDAEASMAFDLLTQEIERSVAEPAFYVLAPRIDEGWIGSWPAHHDSIARFAFRDIAEILQESNTVWIDRERGVSLEFQRR